MHGRRSPDFRIIRGGLADVPEVARLGQAALPEAWPEEEIAATLRTGGLLWVARGNKPLVGYLLAQRVVDELHLLQIVVAARWRGRGVGRALMQALEAEAPDACAIYLEVRRSNRRAIRFYEGLGFVRVGLRPNYYAPVAGLPAEDALLMRKEMTR